ncbi:Rv2175c family DNA-binding protein [Corynebacterium yudongzhengii]|uniref:Rv2175c family DNA-binding protein n=1 Tax=Corynebacterium yudongzhengii TaxID=2080740 RepID=UPI001304F838|nr:Rv2175c family DNA-binding protein [Corynebacterium yudongzhengii]
MSNAQDKLEELLADDTLLTLNEVAERLGIPVTKVGDLLDDHKLACTRIDGKKYVPELLLDEDGSINRFASSAITVLIDGGYDDEEILVHLFTEDESLPGRPVDALHGQKAREVIRRAQAMAF